MRKFLFLCFYLELLGFSRGYAEAISPLFQEKKISRDVRPQFQIIDFWASWCKACVGNLKKMHPIVYRANQSNGAVSLQFISIDENREDARNLVSKKMIGPFATIKPYLYIDIENTLPQSYGVSSVPAMIVKGPNNQVIWRHNGALNDRDVTHLMRLLRGNEVAYAH